MRMTVKFKLLKNKPKNQFGYSLVVLVSHLQIRREKEIGRAFESDFDEIEGGVRSSHPDYDWLAPMIMDLKLKARKIIAAGSVNPDEVMRLLFASDDQILLVDFGIQYSKELREMGDRLEKVGDIKKRNNYYGNARVYENVVNQFNALLPGIGVMSLGYNDLMFFKKHQLGIGNSKATVNLYLRTLRSLYNKAIKVYGIEDRKPFNGVFENLKVKSYESKKKYISKESVRRLELMKHNSDSASKYVDLWLLQFYFAGADLMDIYFLKKKQVRNGRLYFERTKTGGLIIDLLVCDKARVIVDKWKCLDENSEWLFPWRKDVDGYKTFLRKMYTYLQKVQERENIEVLPAGGNLASKVARHTFATIAKQNGVDVEVLRELMGHERDEVDNYYKDKFSQEIRDKALLEIIL